MKNKQGSRGWSMRAHACLMRVLLTWLAVSFSLALLGCGAYYYNVDFNFCCLDMCVREWMVWMHMIWNLGCRSLSLIRCLGQKIQAYEYLWCLSVRCTVHTVLYDVHRTVVLQYQLGCGVRNIPLVNSRVQLQRCNCTRLFTRGMFLTPQPSWYCSTTVRCTS